MMGQSTLMHCSGWMELARVEAASSAALTTWNESRANPYVNEVTLDSQHCCCVLGMTARKCLGMFINRSTAGFVEGQVTLRLHILCLQGHLCSSQWQEVPPAWCNCVRVVARLKKWSVTHGRKALPWPGGERAWHLSSHCQRTQTHQLRLTQKVSP